VLLYLYFFKPDCRSHEPNLTPFCSQMFDLMYAAKGAGLAAPQVGRSERLIVFNEMGDERQWLNEMVLVNPRIVEKSPNTDVETEGCLSFPGMDGPVSRPVWVKVEAQTTNGQPFRKTFSGWEARLFQHEFDHLEGIMYVDHLGGADRAEAQPVIDALVRQFGSGGTL